MFHEITNIALVTRSWVLCEAERERRSNTVLFTLNYLPKRFLPVSEYLKMQERFAGMRNFPEMVQQAQEIIDSRWSFWRPVLEANGINHEEEQTFAS